jgi:hypothetical protein
LKVTHRERLSLALLGALATFFFSGVLMARIQLDTSAS